MMLNNALSYLEMGWSVIPLKRQDKVPNFTVLPSWQEYQERLPEEAEVVSWWTQDPYANIGIVTGHVSNIIVQDVDSIEGMAYMEVNGGIPNTPVSRTGNGIHVVYRHPEGDIRNFTRRVPGIDLRADGGYIVAPPSIHPSGRRYQWQVFDVEPAHPPDWFMELINRDEMEQWLAQTLSSGARTYNDKPATYWQRAMMSELDRLARAREGNRNNTLVKAAFRLGQIVAAGGLDEEEVEKALFLAAQSVGLGSREIIRTIRSGMSAGMLNPRR